MVSVLKRRNVRDVMDKKEKKDKNRKMINLDAYK